MTAPAARPFSSQLPAAERATPGPRRPRAVVVGGGFGGLAVAIRLLADGHDVTVVERRATVGGRASQIRDAGYTWDTGPSLITMPELFDELFRMARELAGGRSTAPRAGSDVPDLLD